MPVSYCSAPSFDMRLPWVAWRVPQLRCTARQRTAYIAQQATLMVRLNALPIDRPCDMLVLRFRIR